jgi:hypothetical protein
MLKCCIQKTKKPDVSSDEDLRQPPSTGPKTANTTPAPPIQVNANENTQ